jgi:hypothetical protein
MVSEVAVNINDPVQYVKDWEWGGVNCDLVLSYYSSALPCVFSLRLSYSWMSTHILSHLCCCVYILVSEHTCEDVHTHLGIRSGIM